MLIVNKMQNIFLKKEERKKTIDAFTTEGKDSQNRLTGSFSREKQKYAMRYAVTFFLKMSFMQENVYNIPTYIS